MTPLAVRHEGEADPSAEYNPELSSAMAQSQPTRQPPCEHVSKRSLTANCAANHLRLTKIASIVNFCVKSTSKCVEGMCPLL